MERLKRQEEQLRHQVLILDQVQDAVIVIDNDTIITYMNSAAYRMYDIDPKEPVLGSKLGEFFRFEWQTPQQFEGYTHAIQASGVWKGEKTHVTHKERRIWGESVISLTKDSAGNPAGVVAVVRDITDRVRTELDIKRLNEELSMRAQELEFTNRELESFSYSVTHDLRGPLHAMIGLGEVLIEDYGQQLDKDGYRLTMQIIDSGKKMLLLIDDILSLSKVSSQELHIEEIDISEIVQKAVAELRRKEPRRHIEVRIHPVGKIYADYRMVLIVMNNLIGNSWKYTQKTENAQIEFGSIEKKGELIYYVRDNGAGFDMKYAYNLFVPFKRLHADKEFAGTGIGLSIVKRIIDRHGGRIWAEGEPGKGSAFYFTVGKKNNK